MSKYPHLTGDLKLPIQPVHRSRFARLLRRLNRCAELDRRIWNVNSGYRSTKEQAVLYDRYLHHGGNLAARPGSSNHERGTAADVGVAGEAVGASTNRRRLLKDHGLCLPVPGEKWHVEVGVHWNA